MTERTPPTAAAIANELYEAFKASCSTCGGRDYVCVECTIYKSGAAETVNALRSAHLLPPDTPRADFNWQCERYSDEQLANAMVSIRAYFPDAAEAVQRIVDEAIARGLAVGEEASIDALIAAAERVADAVNNLRGIHENIEFYGKLSVALDTNETLRAALASQPKDA